jgi:hypothetical protein
LLCAFLKVLSRNGPEYDSDGIDYNNHPHMLPHRR